MMEIKLIETEEAYYQTLERIDHLFDTPKSSTLADELDALVVMLN